MKSSRPRFELLEDRYVPVTWGNPWPDALHLTVSFAPDGTQVGDRTSALFSLLNGTGPSTQWQTEILRALQTWAVNANINIGLVADGGQAFGTAGRPQGDPRFGDVRFAAYPMSTEVMAISSPFDTTAGTWAGDVKLNSAYNYGIGGSGDIDLFTAMLHEVAHVYGLDHSEDPASAVFEHYNGVKTGLTAEDIGRLQNLYGARGPDQFEGTSGNGTFGSATMLSLLKNPDGSLGIQATGDITTGSDVDMFRFQAPLNLGTMRINLNTNGISLLTPRLTIYDSNQRVLKTVTSSGPFNGDLSVDLSGLMPLKTYYVKVEGASGDVFGIGSYDLEVKSIPLLGSLTSLLGSTVNTLTSTLLNDDLHTNDSFLTASLLAPLANQTASRFDYAFKGSIRDSWDVDYYRIQAPAGTSPTVLSVMLWGTDNDGLIPQASVYDASTRPVASEIVVNENGIFVLQVTNAQPGATYYVKVAAVDPKGAHNTGNYFLGIDFGGQPVQLDTLAQGTLTATQREYSSQLNLTESQLFHYVLSASTSSSTPILVRMGIYDSNGVEMATLEVQTGQPAVSITVTLPKGIYTIRILASTLNGSPLPQVDFTLRGSKISDPIGPQSDDPTEAPAGSTTTTTTTTDEQGSPPDSTGYDTAYGSDYSDPYSDPTTDTSTTGEDTSYGGTYQDPTYTGEDTSTGGSYQDPYTDPAADTSSTSYDSSYGGSYQDPASTSSDSTSGGSYQDPYTDPAADTTSTSYDSSYGGSYQDPYVDPAMDTSTTSYDSSYGGSYQDPYSDPTYTSTDSSYGGDYQDPTAPPPSDTVTGGSDSSYGSSYSDPYA